MTQMPSADRFSWLHLTDHHQGMSGHDSLWPQVREAFFLDLERVFQHCGPWDVVLFTGDLTQRGAEAEFERLDQTLAEIWTVFRKLGCDPVLLAVPGNHDLIRPSKLDPAQAALIGLESVRTELWQDVSAYRESIDRVFVPFTTWWARHAAKIPADWSLRTGRLPGEWSVQVPIGDFKIGIVGLNSAYLQLTGDDFEGKLYLDVQQFHATCDGDGPKWAKNNATSLLLTHHGPEWLSSAAREHLRAEIDVPPRFIAHLHGHMHAPVIEAMSEGGAVSRRRWQGCSLFGLEYIRDEVERLHGYAAGVMTLETESILVRTWHRSAVKTQAGTWELGVDRSMNCDPDGAVVHEPIQRPQSTTLAAAREHLAVIQAYKNLHDCFHQIEVLCLKPLQDLQFDGMLAEGLEDILFRLRAEATTITTTIEAQRAQLDADVIDAIETSLPRTLRRFAEYNDDAAALGPEDERRLVARATTELRMLLGQIPTRLEDKLAASHRQLHDDPRLRGGSHIESDLADLARRVQEHSLLQKIDNELRSAKLPSSGEIREFHWQNAKEHIDALDALPPISTALCKFWPRHRQKALEIDAEIKAGKLPDDSKEIDQLAQRLATVFVRVDAELKDRLAMLMKSSTHW